MDSIKEKKFSDKLEGLRHFPNGELIRRIDSKIFSLDANRVYHYRPDILAEDEYKRCLELFERRLPQYASMNTSAAAAMTHQSLMNLENTIFVKENPYQDELKKIAVEIATEMFDIPGHVNILPELDFDKNRLDTDQDDSPESFLSLSEEEKREMRDEIHKRIILNGLVHGAAMHIWKSAYYIVKEKIDNLNTILMPLYDQYTSSVGWIIWQMNPDSAMDSIDEHSMTQGSNSLDFQEDECDIHCHGINFPVLLHEVVKGAIDYLICHGIPKAYSEEQLEYYYAKADDYQNEYWHYILSPALWTRMIDAAGVTTQEIPLVIARLTQLNYQELSEVMIGCIDGKEIGNLKLQAKKIV